MALVKGTNCGFVLVAPTADPAPDGFSALSNNAYGGKFTAPTGAGKVIEIGWYTREATTERNFEVGIYDHNVGDDNPEAVVGALSQINAKGTDAGWKKVTGLDIPITAGTIYWIALQLDSGVATSLDWQTDGGEKQDFKTTETALTDPWGASDGTAGRLTAIYAVWKRSSGTVSTKEISKTDIPEGIGDIQNLIPEGLNGVTSTVLSKERVGLEL